MSWGCILNDLKNFTRWLEESQLFSVHVAEQQEIMQNQTVCGTLSLVHFNPNCYVFCYVYVFLL